MTDALVPDTALVQADAFRDRLPDGWMIRGWQAAIYPDWSGRADHILQVELWHRRGTRVELTLRRTPDWDWLTNYLNLAVTMPVGLDAQCDVRELWP